MSIHFHQLAVKKIIHETAACISVSFDVPAHLRETFAYSHGQNITLRATINGQDIRRSYSLCTAPYENELKVAIKKMEGGLFSTWANEALRPGMTLDVLPPTGRFQTACSPDHQKNYLLFAAGSGITPVISIIKTVLKTEPGSRVTLVYGNRSRAGIIFFEELEALKNRYLERFSLIHILSRERMDAELNFGRIDAAKLAELGKLLNYQQMDEVFVCGPEQMIFCVKDFMQAQGVDAKKVHFELFSTPGQQQQAAVTAGDADNTGPASTVTARLDGRSFTFQLPFTSKLSILDAALQQGADLPYACKGGVCCTCRAKLMEGEVVMDVNYALEQEEVEAGFILTCQSHPKTERVVVDWDVK